LALELHPAALQAVSRDFSGSCKSGPLALPFLLAHNPLQGVIDMRQKLLISLAVAGTLVAADLPYSGKWRMNPAKSDFGESSVTLAQTASGEMQYTADGQSYTFKFDGKDYPALFGQTV
jgi:hypothetical protein